MRVWFNRTFSSVHAAISLIREADVAGEFHLIYSNTNPLAIAGRAAHQFNEEPTGLDDAAYADWCLDFCKTQHVDVFWPGRAAGLLSSQHARFADIGTRIVSVATTAMLDLLHDKARFYASVDLPDAVPAQSLTFCNIAEFDAAFAHLRPLHATLCVKPSSSVYGLGFSVLDDTRNTAQLLMEGLPYRVSLADFRAGLALQNECRPMLLMEYLDGQEYSVDCIADYGVLKCAIPRRKPVSAGSGQLIDLRADVLKATAKLTSDYGLNAVFNVQFREQEGALRILEINPRMSGGIGMACVAGPKLPYLALCGFVHGYDQVVIPAVRDGIRVGEVACAVAL
ncbi:ATP-grasp domain-containing protein [Actimicrobium sp. CCI2.3]|uniref:ATP-grasp domain-containing protein n=1 Tax=Actimicrobium sp. CCI2.3 TaxID=3048616 RepID=UPI002AB54F4F|nr:ATP-grasp domain-containing protein [Actimicrobium sp. CCI2.3]MDY7575097.1 ATP-grasp domain-containing protein [Actimicrobium sp. CCI2.3]MEB0022562.1 ATP-grasp domain-containing protein [Actimicrobium sp. CCI2.3]